MAIIQDNGTHWIEEHYVSGSVGATTQTQNNITLDRAGTFLGIVASMHNASGTVATQAGSTISITGLASTEMEYGDRITGFTTRRTNNTGGAFFMGIHVLIWLRKNN